MPFRIVNEGPETLIAIAVESSSKPLSKPIDSVIIKPQEGAGLNLDELDSWIIQVKQT